MPFPLLRLIQLIKVPLRIFNLVGSLGYWAPWASKGAELPRLMGSSDEWNPWAPISPLRHLVSLTK